MDQNKDFLNVVLNNKRALAEIFLATILMSIGVNILISFIVKQVDTDRYIFFIGMAFILLALFFFFFPIVKNLRFRRSYDGFFIVETPTDDLHSVYRYDYVSKINRWINDARQSNPALDKIWQQHPVPKQFKASDAAIQDDENNPKNSLTLMQQVTEAYVLSKLSNHIHDYFHKNQGDTNRVVLIPKDRLPKPLQQNPFLHLALGQKRKIEEEVLGEDDEENLSQETLLLEPKVGLVVPRGANLKWRPNRQMEISNRRLKIVTQVTLTGRPFFLPAGFQQNYLGVRDQDDLRVYAATVNFEISFSYLSIFSTGYWKFYYWLDACMRSFEKGFVGGTFFNTIGWDKTMTLIACQSQARQQAFKARQTGSYNNNHYNHRPPNP
jgi:hypothetical protein